MTLIRWLSFRGRISRRTWWLGYLLPVFGISILIGLVLGTVFGMQAGSRGQTPDAARMSLIPTITALLSMWPLLAGSVKRLHDRDRSGWWVLLQQVLVFVPIVLLAALQARGRLGDPTVSLALLGVGLGIGILSLWLFIEIYFLRGTMGPNRFGDDPLGPPGPLAPRYGAAPAWQPPQQSWGDTPNWRPLRRD